MTAYNRKFMLIVASLIVSAPSVATVFDIGPMGYHNGAALLVRVIAVFLASTSLATVFGVAGYLYWLHVVAPSPRTTGRRTAGA